MSRPANSDRQVAYDNDYSTILSAAVSSSVKGPLELPYDLCWANAPPTQLHGQLPVSAIGVQRRFVKPTDQALWLQFSAE